MAAGLPMPLTEKGELMVLPEDWRMLLRTPPQTKHLSFEARRRVRIAIAEKAKEIAGGNLLAFAAKRRQLHAVV